MDAVRSGYEGRQLAMTRRSPGVKAGSVQRVMTGERQRRPSPMIIPDVLARVIRVDDRPIPLVLSGRRPGRHVSRS